MAPMRVVLSSAVALTLLALGSPARAQLQMMPGPSTPSPMTVPGVTDGARANLEATPEHERPANEARQSVRLFDGRRTGFQWELGLGPIWVRKVEDENPAEARANSGYRLGEISFGTATVTPKKPFFIMGVQKTLVRFMGAKSFSWSVFQQDLGGGIRLGPFEPEVRIGLSLLSIDYIQSQFSAQLMSPRTSVGLGLNLGKFRLDIKAHTEYLWRWFGPDYLSQGITLGFRLDIPRPKSPFVDAR